MALRRSLVGVQADARRAGGMACCGAACQVELRGEVRRVRGGAGPSLAAWRREPPESQRGCASTQFHSLTSMSAPFRRLLSPSSSLDALARCACRRAVSRAARPEQAQARCFTTSPAAFSGHSYAPSATKIPTRSQNTHNPPENGQRSSTTKPKTTRANPANAPSSPTTSPKPSSKTAPTPT